MGGGGGTGQELLSKNIFRCYTANEVLDLLDDADFLQNVEVTITPPNNGDLSDEDSDQEDGGDINHLPAGILNAQAEFKANCDGEIIRSNDDDVEASTHVLVEEQNTGDERTESDSKNNSQNTDSEADIDFVNHAEVVAKSIQLDSSTFAKCKDIMRSRKDDLAILNSTEEASSNADLKQAIRVLVDHIERTVSDEANPGDLKAQLWAFTARFTNSDVEKLQQLYKFVSCRKRPLTRSDSIRPDEPMFTDDEESTSGDDSSSSLSSEDELEPEDVFKPFLTEKGVPLINLKWKKCDLKTLASAFRNVPLRSLLNRKITPYALFNLFFDEEVIQFIVEMTNMYAAQKGHNFRTTDDEVRLFLAILLLSGYNELPRKYLYWEQQSDVFNEAVSAALPRARFDQMFRYLHLCNNDKPGNNDNMWKLRPFYDLINKRFLKYRTNTETLSIDESMVPYFGRHPCKQRIANKPIRVGYKLWVLAENTGYVIHFDPYQGAKGGQSARASPTVWGLGEKTVLSLLEVLPEKTSYDVYFDNFFTSFRLLCFLRDNDIKATGTVNKKKIASVPIKQPNDLSKTPRGYSEHMTTVDNKVTVVGWHDNREVYLASNAHPSLPKVKVDRFDAKAKKRILVPQPGSFQKYNKGMGGVDRCDQNVAKYRISMRGKKWWWALFAWVPDMVVQNCWLLYRAYKSKCNAERYLFLA